MEILFKHSNNGNNQKSNTLTLEEWRHKADISGLSQFYLINYNTSTLLSVQGTLTQEILNQIPPVKVIGKESFGFNINNPNNEKFIINLPSTVEEIQEQAFKCAHQYISGISLNEGLRVIKYEAFSHCSNLTNVEFPSTLKFIGTKAFSECNIRKLVFPEGFESLGSEAFSYNFNLESVVIPNSLRYISDKPFFACKSLKHIRIGLDIPRKLIYSDDQHSSIPSSKEVKFTTLQELSNYLMNGLK